AQRRETAGSADNRRRRTPLKNSQGWRGFRPACGASQPPWKGSIRRPKQADRGRARRLFPLQRAMLAITVPLGVGDVEEIAWTNGAEGRLAPFGVAAFQHAHPSDPAAIRAHAQPDDPARAGPGLDGDHAATTGIQT